jgi:hypothetical protein
MNSSRDSRMIVIRIITTIAVVVISLCFMNIYSVLKSMRAPVAEPAPLPLSDIPANAAFSPFDFLSERIEVNGMPVEWKPDAWFDHYVAELQSNGWAVIEADWEQLRSVSPGESVMLSRSNSTCYVMGLPGGQGVLTTAMSSNEVPGVSQNPWESATDVPGRDFEAVTRPSGSVRVFSLLFGDAAGAVCYRCAVEGFESTLNEFVMKLEKAGWQAVAGDVRSGGMGWMVRDGEQCGVFVSTQEVVDGNFLTVFYQCSGRKPPPP